MRHLFLHNAEGGTRTRMARRPRDFKSVTHGLEAPPSEGNASIEVRADSTAVRGYSNTYRYNAGSVLRVEHPAAVLRFPLERRFPPHLRHLIPGGAA